jgi:hypothetical protein
LHAFGLSGRSLTFKPLATEKEIEMSVGSDQIRQGWWVYLIEVAFAKNYTAPYLIDSGGPAPNNPILDHLLPSLLVVKLGSLVDEALSEFIVQKGLTISTPYRDDFNGKINFFQAHGDLKDATKLHNLRQLRNKLAHEANIRAKWSELDLAIDTADEELQHLGFVGPRPQFELSSECNPVEPPDPKYLMSLNYRVMLRSEERKVAEFTWSRHILPDDE